jgi:hypothetical protein
MIRTPLIFCFAIVLTAAAAAVPQRIAFDPDKAWFTAGDRACLSQQFTVTSAGSAELELIPGYIVETVSVLVGGKEYAKWAAVERRVPTKDDPGAYGLLIDGLAAGNRVVASYYCSGGFRAAALLDVDLDPGSGSTPIATWKASISNLCSFPLSGCESWFASGTSVDSDSRNDGETWSANANLMYPLGMIDLPAKSSTLATAAKRPIEAKRSYFFETSSIDGPVEYISFVNAFGFDLCPSACLVRRGTLVLNRSSITYIAQGGTVRVESTVERRLEVYRSVATKQVGQSNTTLPFEHEIRYELRNRTGTELEATIYFRKQYGYNNRNDYNFDQQPSSQAGDGYAWTQQIKKDGSMIVTFKIRSDQSRFSEYSQYEDFEGGR